ncbi:MAG: sodium:solute symporter, partial [Rhodobacteraceae bacterium]|nr:sodium:solute symporter [Paracoccaceae bacterium]
MSSAVALWGSIMAFKAFNQQALIDTVLDLANYTYGPLLGLFFVGMFTSWKPSGKALVLACMASPLLIYGLKQIPF